MLPTAEGLAAALTSGGGVCWEGEVGMGSQGCWGNPAWHILSGQDGTVTTQMLALAISWTAFSAAPSGQTPSPLLPATPRRMPPCEEQDKVGWGHRTVGGHLGRKGAVYWAGSGQLGVCELRKAAPCCNPWPSFPGKGGPVP